MLSSPLFSLVFPRVIPNQLQLSPTSIQNMALCPFNNPPSLKIQSYHHNNNPTHSQSLIFPPSLPSFPTPLISSFPINNIINKMISPKSSHQPIRSTYNFQTAHQKQTKEHLRHHDRILTQPINLNAPQKFTQTIQQMQSKIEGVENLMKRKGSFADQNASDRDISLRGKNIDKHAEGSRSKGTSGNVSTQNLQRSAEPLIKYNDYSPIRKSYRLPQPKKHNEESPLKIPPLNLHTITDPQHSHSYANLSPASNSTSPSPPRKVLSKFYQSKSFVELPPNQAENSFTLKLNGSFLNSLNQEQKEKTNEINLFNLANKKPQPQKLRKVSDHISYLNIKQTINKMKNKNNPKNNSSSNKTIIQGFQLGRLLGKGKFGEVYLARHIQTGFLVAMKKVHKKKLEQLKMVNQFINEVKLHHSLDHPTIVKFYGLLQEKDSFYLAMEYINGGTLFDFQNEVGVLNIRQAVDFLKDIIDALAYLHDRSIAHRDIKPQNIVITSAGIAKLCDFGWSTVVESTRSTFCGTLDYAPPEIIQRKSYDCTVDLWCVGILTYELFVGRAPFQSQNRNQVMERIVNIDRQGIPKISEVPPEAREFIEALLQKDPTRRPRISQLLDFPLFGSVSPSKKKDKSYFK